MSTENHHYLDFPATLPIYPSPRTYNFWEFHPTSPCLLKISSFVKNLGVGYKVTSIISVSRISQCNHLEFLPILQSLFFCFVHVLWFDIRRFWRFRRWEENSWKLIPQKRSFGPFPRQKIPQKNCMDPSAKITPLPRKITTGISLFLQPTIAFIFNASFLSTIPC